MKIIAFLLSAVLAQAQPWPPEIPPDLKPAPSPAKPAAPSSPAEARLLDAIARAKADPVSHESLKKAILTHEGVEAVARLFEIAIASRFARGGAVSIPEIGGYSFLDEKIQFVPIEDPTKYLLPKVYAAREDLDALAKLFADHPKDMEHINFEGQLSDFVKKAPSLLEKGYDRAQVYRVLKTLAVGAVELAADRHTFDDDDVLVRKAAQKPWSGRFSGQWHIHPPRHTKTGWECGEDCQKPTAADAAIASTYGQNLTISFRPDGFTVYDLSPLAGSIAPDPSAARKIEYRGAEWGPRFAALHKTLDPERDHL